MANKMKAAALVVVIVATVALLCTGCASSTSGVKVVGDNVLLLPTGERAELTETVGKTRRTWKITFDGRQTVHFECTALCPDHEVAVPNIGDKATAPSSFLKDDFVVTRTSSDAVKVSWPWGINLR